MAFLERLKLRRSAHAGDADAPAPLPIAPRLKARITKLSQLFAPAGSARKLTPAAGLEGAPDPATIFGARMADTAPDAHTDLPLDTRVWTSAERIYERPSEMNAGARAVASAAAARIDGSVSLVAWTVRVMIGLAWTAIAMQLVAAELFGAGGAMRIVGLGRIAPEDWLALAEIFGLAGGVAVLGAFAGAALVMFGGNGDNKRVRAASEELGQTAADLAREFDENLDELRRRMDARARPVDAVADLSQSHLTAVEAAVFFRNIQFITDIRDARQKFVGYIRRTAGGGGAGSGDAEMRAFILGILVGGGFAIGLIGDGIDLSDLPTLEGLNPVAEVWILLGSLLYLTVGLLAEAARGLYAGAVSEGVYGEALEAFRAGYVSRKPPRITDVVRRINDALEVYKARVGAGGGQASVHAQDETPSWRRGPEAPRFVETGFQAAPKSFRADPPASEKRAPRKIF